MPGTYSATGTHHHPVPAVSVVLGCLDRIAIEIEHRADFDAAAGHDPAFTQAGLALRLAWRVVANQLPPHVLATSRVPYSTATPTRPASTRREDPTCD